MNGSRVWLYSTKLLPADRFAIIMCICVCALFSPFLTLELITSRCVCACVFCE